MTMKVIKITYTVITFSSSNLLGNRLIPLSFTFRHITYIRSFVSATMRWRSLALQPGMRFWQHNRCFITSVGDTDTKLQR